MIAHRQKESLIKYKLIYSALILLIYLFGKNLPLYGIDVSVYADRTLDAEALLMQTISGDLYRCSVFALGVSPYMLASIIVQVVVACRSADEKNRISPRKKNQWTLAFTMGFAALQAVINIHNLTFVSAGIERGISQGIAVIEMVTGALVILRLSERNARYGIGGQSILIFANIADGLINSLNGHELNDYVVPVVVSAGVLIIIVIMENAEIRIPLQRISIHNIYADKNYIAIKLNPIGVMPAMFSAAFFMLPQFLLTGISYIFPMNEKVMWLQENMSLSKPLGIAVYIAILYALTIGFSRVFLNPSEITEQFLKSGDSIRGVHAGRDTKKFLSRRITAVSILSATVISLCLGIPMVLQLYGRYEGGLSTLPSSVMMLTGVWCNLYREAASLRDLDAYRPFI